MCALQKYDHPLECGIVEFLEILDPSTFWIQCKKCIKIDVIKKQLRSVVNSYKRSGDIFRANINDFVIIKDVDKEFYRGVVVNKGKYKHCDIILIDTSENVTIHKKNIYPLPDSWVSIKEQAHLVRVNGVIPFKCSSTKLKTFKKILNRIINKAEYIEVTEYYKLDSDYYGQFMLRIGSHIISLDDILIDKKFVKPSMNFEEDVKNLSSNSQSILKQDKRNEGPITDEDSEDDISNSPFAKKKTFCTSPQEIVSLKAYSLGLGNYMNVESVTPLASPSGYKISTKIDDMSSSTNVIYKFGHSKQENHVSGGAGCKIYVSDDEKKCSPEKFLLTKNNRDVNDKVNSHPEPRGFVHNRGPSTSVSDKLSHRVNESYTKQTNVTACNENVKEGKVNDYKNCHNYKQTSLTTSQNYYFNEQRGNNRSDACAINKTSETGSAFISPISSAYSSSNSQKKLSSCHSEPSHYSSKNIKFIKPNSESTPLSNENYYIRRSDDNSYISSFSTINRDSELVQQRLNMSEYNDTSNMTVSGDSNYKQECKSHNSASFQSNFKNRGTDKRDLYSSHFDLYNKCRDDRRGCAKNRSDTESLDYSRLNRSEKLFAQSTLEYKDENYSDNKDNNYKSPKKMKQLAQDNNFKNSDNIGVMNSQYSDRNCSSSCSDSFNVREKISPTKVKAADYKPKSPCSPGKSYISPSKSRRRNNNVSTERRSVKNDRNYHSQDQSLNLFDDYGNTFNESSQYVSTRSNIESNNTENRISLSKRENRNNVSMEQRPSVKNDRNYSQDQSYNLCDDYGNTFNESSQYVSTRSNKGLNNTENKISPYKRKNRNNHVSKEQCPSVKNDRNYSQGQNNYNLNADYENKPNNRSSKYCSTKSKSELSESYSSEDRIVDGKYYDDCKINDQSKHEECDVTVTPKISKNPNNNRDLLDNPKTTDSLLTGNESFPPKSLGRGKYLRAFTHNFWNNLDNTEKISIPREKTTHRFDDGDNLKQESVETTDNLINSDNKINDDIPHSFGNSDELNTPGIRSLESSLKDSHLSKNTRVIFNEDVALSCDSDQNSNIDNTTEGDENNISSEHKDSRTIDKTHEEHEGFADICENIQKELPSVPTPNIREETRDETKPQQENSYSLVQMRSLRLEPEILSDYSVGHMADNMKLFCGIIHGEIQLEPVSKISDLKLHEYILNNLLKRKMSDLSRSQMYSTPVLLERRNLFLIGPPNTGKTLACIISILSLLLDKNHYKGLKAGNGPRCVFVTASSESVNRIGLLCSVVCGDRLSVITTHGGGLEFERKIALANGCEILITTPRCWQRLLKHSSVTNLARLCHIVLDDTDKLLELFLPEVLELMTLTKKMIYVRKQMCPLDLQVVLVGEKWTPVLEECLTHVEMPVLCITAYLEAALYSRVKPKTHILQPGAKLNKLKELLNNSRQKLRTIVVCQSADEVDYLRTEFISMPNVLIAHEDMCVTLICEVSKKWANSPPNLSTLLICTDSIVGELGIANAQHLIHFSLPSNKSYFSERFGVIKEYFCDRIKNPKSCSPDCLVDILVDNTNEQQFPEIVTFMKRMHANIPKEIMDVVSQLYLEREIKKIDVPICERILMFGTCWKKDRCKMRHVFNKDLDVPKNLPLSGLVKVKLLHIINPSHYSVRILSKKDNESDSWQDVKNNYFLIGLKMSNHFSNRKNRIPNAKVNVGDMVAVEVETDVLYKRAVVTEILSRDERRNPNLVNVHIIDEGYFKEYKAIELLNLPQELQMFEQESFDLYLTGLLPVDFDNDWSFSVLRKLEQVIGNLNDNEEDPHFLARILVAVGNNIIVNSLQHYEWLELSKCHIVKFSPKKFILENGLAVVNENHMKNITNLANAAEIVTSKIDDVEVMYGPDFDEAETIQWAHLEKDTYVVSHVIHSVNPSCFYISIYKFCDRLELLQKDLADELDTKIIKPNFINPNMVCAVKNPEDNVWNRAILLEVLENYEAEFFSVDYGDKFVAPISNISLIPKGLITKLPFQAIECSLVGITPLNEYWLPEANLYFEELTMEGDVLKPLHVKVCETNLKATTTGGRHYQIILVDANTEPQVVLNKELVFSGFANWDVITKTYLTENSHIIESMTPSQVDDFDDEPDKDFKCDKDFECDKDNLNYHNNENSVIKQERSEPEEINVPNNNHSTIPKIPLDDETLLSFDNGTWDIHFSTTAIMETFLFPKETSNIKKLPALEEGGGGEDMENKKVKEKKPDEKLLNTTEDNSDSKSTSSVEDVSISDLPTPDTNLITFGILHPPIVWSQDDESIRLKIILPDIKKYYMNCTDERVDFQTNLGDKCYWFALDLFGPVCSETFKYLLTGLHLKLKVDKYLKGEDWPRLTYCDIKHSWIKLDVDSFNIREEDKNLIDYYCERGLNEGNIPREKVVDCLENTVDSEGETPDDNDETMPNNGDFDDVIGFIDYEDDRFID